MSYRQHAAGAAAAIVATLALTPADAALNLATYAVEFQRTLDIEEGSGITWNYDKNVLFIVDDEGVGGGEYSTTGDRLTNDTFVLPPSSRAGAHDIEGVTYIGNGQYVVAEERTQELIRLGVASTNNGGTLPANVYSFTVPQYYLFGPPPGTPSVGNNGLEGVAFDPIDNGYFGVKQQSPQRFYFAEVSFGATTTGTTSEPLSSAALAALGLASLSDVAVLAQDPGLAGTDYYENLLLLSAGSSRLVEIDRSGQLLSSFDLSGFDVGAFEGVTLDRSGNIFLVSDDGDRSRPSTLVKLSRVVPAVPEPATWAMMVAGFGAIGAAMRRRRSDRPAAA